MKFAVTHCRDALRFNPQLLQLQDDSVGAVSGQVPVGRMLRGCFRTRDVLIIRMAHHQNAQTTGGTRFGTGRKLRKYRSGFGTNNVAAQIKLNIAVKFVQTGRGKFLKRLVISATQSWPLLKTASIDLDVQTR